LQQSDDDDDDDDDINLLPSATIKLPAQKRKASPEEFRPNKHPRQTLASTINAAAAANKPKVFFPYLA
jgi:hypothetical protein